MTNTPTTPAELERELGTPARQIRKILRARYGLLTEQGHTRWELDDEQVAHVRSMLRQS